MGQIPRSIKHISSFSICLPLKRYNNLFCNAKTSTFAGHVDCYISKRWWRGLAVTRSSRSTQLLYVGPG